EDGFSAVHGVLDGWGEVGEIPGGPVPAPHHMTVGHQVFRPCASNDSQTQDRDIHIEPSFLASLLAFLSPVAELVCGLSGWRTTRRHRENRLIMARLNAGKSPGWRLVTQLASLTTSRSVQWPLALRISS